MLLAAAEAPAEVPFDLLKDNLGMAAVAVVVLVVWLLFRKMLELSERPEPKQKKP